MEAVMELIDLIYQAVTDDSRWPSFLEAFVRATRSRRAALALRDLDREEFPHVCWFGWSDEDIQIYFERFAAIDPLRIGAARTPEGAVGFDTDACPREQLECCAAFREFYAPRDCYYGMAGTILVTDTGQSFISTLRGTEDGPFGEFERATLRALMPHLKRAALLHGEFGSMRRRLAAFTAHLDRYPHAFLLTDAECRVLYANPKANEIAGLEDGFVVRAGRIHITSPKTQTSFRQTLGNVIAGRKQSLQRLEVRRRSGKKPYRVLVMPVPDSRAISLGVAQPSAAILIVDGHSGPQPDPAVLAEMFSLTPAESRVTARLALGRSVEEIAEETSISIETVRTHVRRILSKTATGRQAELISLVLRTVPFGD
jgi:DNA-binding CsgD family transcriptional regulator